MKRLKRLRQRIRCLFGYHDYERKEEKLGYYMGLFPTTNSKYKCKHCGDKRECCTSRIF